MCADEVTIWRHCGVRGCRTATVFSSWSSRWFTAVVSTHSFDCLLAAHYITVITEAFTYASCEHHTRSPSSASPSTPRARQEYDSTAAERTLGRGTQRRVVQSTPILKRSNRLTPVHPFSACRPACERRWTVWQCYVSYVSRRVSSVCRYVPFVFDSVSLSPPARCQHVLVPRFDLGIWTVWYSVGRASYTGRSYT